MNKQLSQKTPRIEVADALRGFPVYPTTQPGWLKVLNTGVFNVTFSLFAGKAYAIFALLFGSTFYIQYAN